MFKKGPFLSILLLCLMMVGIIGWSVTAQQRSLSLIRFQAKGFSLNLYQEPETGRYQLYLPAFASPEDLTVSHSGAKQIRFFSGTEDYEHLSQVPLDRDVTMELVYSWGAEDQYTLRLMQCSAKQTIHLETKDGTMALIDSSQDNEANVAVTILDAQGGQEYQGHAVISGRGNGTWYWPKKPYDLKFPEKITVGGFQETDKLCLLAEYFDESKLRNAMAYHAGAMLEIPYASGYEFADVYIDGVYNGIYGLTTKREYTKDPSVQLVFELSSSCKGNFFYTDYDKQIRIHRGSQRDILYYAERFENALMARDWDALWQAADMTSWARKYALDEFFYNYDLPLTSQYYYVDGDGTVKCMLPWDYEWVFYPRMSPYDFNQERALAAYYSTGNWYEILLENEDFRLAVAQVLREEFTGSFFGELEQYLADCVGELTGSWHCDRIRWHADYAKAPAADGGQALLADYAQRFRGYFDSRREFLVDLLENWEDYRLLLFFSEKDGQRYQSNLQIIVPAGTPMAQYRQNIIDTLTSLADQAPLSITTGDGTPLENVDIITENLVITAIY